MVNGERRWVGAGLDPDMAGHVLDELRSHVAVAPEFLEAVQGILGPGDTQVVTPDSVVPPSIAAAPIE